MFHAVYRYLLIYLSVKSLHLCIRMFIINIFLSISLNIHKRIRKSIIFIITIIQHLLSLNCNPFSFWCLNSFYIVYFCFSFYEYTWVKLMFTTINVTLGLLITCWHFASSTVCVPHISRNRYDMQNYKFLHCWECEEQTTTCHGTWCKIYFLNFLLKTYWSLKYIWVSKSISKVYLIIVWIESQIFKLLIE